MQRQAIRCDGLTVIRRNLVLPYDSTLSIGRRVGQSSRDQGVNSRARVDDEYPELCCAVFVAVGAEDATDTLSVHFGDPCRLGTCDYARSRPTVAQRALRCWCPWIRCRSRDSCSLNTTLTETTVSPTSIRCDPPCVRDLVAGSRNRSVEDLVDYSMQLIYSCGVQLINSTGEAPWRCPERLPAS